MCGSAQKSFFPPRRFKSTCRSFSKRMASIIIMHESHVAKESSLTVQARRVQERRIQCNGETVCKISGWLCWAVRQGLVWQWPSRQRRRERASLSPRVVRSEFRKQLHPSVETHRGRQLTSRTNEPLPPSFRSLAFSIIWYSRRESACICTTLPPRISNRPDTPLSCVIGRRSPRSNTEAPKFASKALSCSQPESLAGARERDG